MFVQQATDLRLPGTINKFTGRSEVKNRCTLLISFRAPVSIILLLNWSQTTENPDLNHARPALVILLNKFWINKGDLYSLCKIRMMLVER